MLAKALFEYAKRALKHDAVKVKLLVLEAAPGHTWREEQLEDEAGASGA